MKKSNETASLYKSGKIISDFYYESGQILSEPNLENVIEPGFVNELGNQ